MKFTANGTGVQAFIGGGANIYGYIVYTFTILCHMGHSVNLLPLTVHCPLTILYKAMHGTQVTVKACGPLVSFIRVDSRKIKSN